MNEDDLKRILARNPAITVERDDEDKPARLYLSCGQVSTPNAKQGETYALVDLAKGKEGSVARPFIKFTFYYKGRCDPDSYRGGEKDLLDGLVKAGIIAGDESDKIILAPPEQIKVHYKKDERTEIEITLP